MRTWKNGILLPFLLVLLWYIISKLQIFSSYLLPSPAATAITAGELIRSGMLWQHLLISLQRVAVASSVQSLSLYLWVSCADAATLFSPIAGLSWNSCVMCRLWLQYR